MKRTCLTSALVITIVAGAALTGGCVTRAELRKVEAANRAMGRQLRDAEQAVRGYKAENEEITKQLDASRVSLKLTDDDLAEAEKQNKFLEMKFDELADKYEKLAGRPPKLDLRGPLPPKVDKALRAFATDNPELLEYLPDYGMVKLKADPTFKKGSAEVEAAGASALEEFAKIVNAPAAERLNIYIAGHTDDIPIVKKETRLRHPDNWYLSVHRAVRVQKVLLRAGVAAHRLGVMGFGEHHPVVPNKAGHGGNEANRRVEIWIVPPSRYLTKRAAETD